ncbi:DUF421 domain-containing protein [Lactobacillus helveticus]|uniref:Uncharacterized protein n=1 Tax=Lactobacillus helveticus TaxID=1587 RepID=A0A3Q8SUN0_LACHE|nr:DUF421 domain-containing protein [Lactobacillus helveticus]AFR22649.1 membrane protein [Lactobacillus helveticus R0052]AZK91336.1 hypothetical protein LH5_01094 [Lactobacillus helveticus]MCJ2189645.1 DUF421 domain-containing protein [Lactobacillus helveticus]MED7627649.1 DUF421 domain-containing protein [Lactobacillus helveticus]MZR05174.1 DUF421 domain-containing protein [Lactobacillus helveticus]
MQLDYTQLFIKLALGILTLIIQINLFGKTNLAPTTALDQLQNYVLGAIIGGIIYNPSITVLQFFLVLIIWTLVVFILKFSRDHNSWIRGVIDGKPVQVIKNGQVLVANCMKAGISANELMFKLRSRGIYSVEKVKNCIFEQNGQLTIIENDEVNIRFPIISDGQVNEDVLELIHKSEAWLEQEVKAAGYNGINDVFLGEYIDGQLRLTGYSK